MRVRRTVLSSLFTAVVAASAWALTPSEVYQEAQSMHASYLDLAARVDACPDGTCSEAADIIADDQALSGKLDQLHADRQALGTCNCGTIDELIADTDAIAVTTDDTIEGWESSS